MLITALCMLLLGTKLGEATTKTEVKYEGVDKITVTEQKDDTIVLPGLGSPPFAPAFFHQGSNFFFNPQIVMPGGVAPMGLMVEEPSKTEICIDNEQKAVEVIIPELIGVEEPAPQVMIIPEVIEIAEPAPQVVAEIEQLPELPIAPEIPLLIVPQLEVEEVKLIEPTLEVEIDRMPIEIPMAPELPQLILPELPLLNPPVPVLVETPCTDLEILVPEVPTLIEKVETMIPVAPELPPLVLPELPLPNPPVQVLVEECDEIKISNRVPTLNEKVETMIPVAPELPPLVLPELPLPNPPVQVLVEECDEIKISNRVPTLIEKVETMIPVAPELPPLVLPELPLPNPPVQVLVEECDEIEISNSIIPEVPILIEEPCEPSGGLYVSEVNVHANEIPPPPELPPLIITEIPQPVVVETKNIILVPAAPEFMSFYPPSLMVTEKAPIMPIDCAQNIIFERVLPNLAVKNGQLVELISIPAKRRAPVVTSIML